MYQCLSLRIVKADCVMKTNWRELISKQELSIPFEVVHIDSHADMGLRGLGIIPNKHFYVLAECQNVKISHLAVQMLCLLFFKL